MKSVSLGVVAVALTLAAVSTGAAHVPTGHVPAHEPTARTARAAACHPSGARTLAAGRYARVFRRGHEVFGCSERNGRITDLGRQGPQIGLEFTGPVAVSGDFAAYGTAIEGVDTTSASVVVRDLRTGRKKLDADATGPVGAESFTSVLAVVLRPDGAVAWTASGASIARPGERREVNRVDARGHHTLLDSGAGIDLHSLRLRGHRLTWRDAGQLRASTI